MERTVIMRTQEGSILHLECHDSLESTHELARKYARMGYSDGYVVFSEAQTKYSSLGEALGEGESERGVYLSCILRPSIFPSQAGFMGYMTAVALISALEEHTTKKLGLGWISDVFCEGRKIGTTTVEGKLDSFSAYEYIIVSFAVKITGNDFPPRLTDLVKKVFESENTSIRFIIAKNILSKFYTLYPKRVKSSEKFMDYYKRMFILGGLKTKYFEAGKKKRCKILGVDNSDGRLIIEAGRKIKHISGYKNIVIPKKIKLKQH